jgi:D-psicose/D-tagatose/L-ribulose 3-epimerase
MRLAFSNLAWDRVDDDAVACLLRSRRVDAVDLVPGKYFAEPEKATDQEVTRVRDWWNSRGMEITGMQALVFGLSDANVFGHTESQAKLLRRLHAICRIASTLGATRLVFGAPKHRDRTGIDDAEVDARACEFFRRLGATAADHGVVICLEPNPESYGCNFMTDTNSTAAVVEAVSHPAIRMQLDLGALAMNGECLAAVVRAHAQLIGHVHASEPDLVPLGDGGTDHAEAAAVLRNFLPEHVIAVEVKAPAREKHLHAIARSLDIACAYR